MAAPVWGAAPSTEAQQAKDEVYRLWNVDSMIRQAADNVARRYNLSPEQTEYTRKIMHERVTRFLEENEEAIWPLVRDLARQQLTGKTFDPANPNDVETAKRIGAGALPLVAKAKQAILQANQEWGQILSPEQKKLHDYDLNEMEGQFGEINQNFERYKAGQPVENPMFPQTPPKNVAPPRPPKPPRVYTPRQAEDRWDQYVQDFIKKYELDPGQRESAESILREYKKRAADYRSSRTKEFTEITKRLSEAFQSSDLQKRAMAQRDEAALNKPIDEMFEEMKRRLDPIPSPAQKKKYEDGVRAKQGPRRTPTTSKAQGQPLIPPPTSQPQAQPATSQPQPPAPAQRAAPPASQPATAAPPGKG